MKINLSLFLSAALISVFLSGCSTRSAMGENENLGAILSQTAVVSTEEPAEAPAAVDLLSDKNSADEKTTYYKLKASMSIYVEAGDYAISMAKSDCSVTAYDADGNALGSVTISKDKSDSVIPHVANLSVPDGGYLKSTADCVAMKK